jgi:peptidoglycan/xylan/chitin deacetylase (PgdA/CDA1 family)
MSDVLDKNTNADGSKMYMSFYVNTGQDVGNWEIETDVADAAYNAYKAGHEIGNHTSTHLYCVEHGEIDANDVDNGKRVSQEEIYKEIKKVEEVLSARGIPKEHQLGFRTPYLRYSDATFRAMTEVGFLYDCSICAASNHTAGNNFFPYTLDVIPGKQELDSNGNLPPDNNANVNRWGKTSPVGEYKGLWELPAMNLAIHPDDMDYVESVFKRKYGEKSHFNGYITGLDWDLWYEAEMNPEQTVRTLMYTLQKTLEGNRAPFTVGVHSQFYFEPKEKDFPNILPQERHAAFEEFIRQASQLKDVYFVSSDMVIRWMQHPVSAAEFKPENYLR